MWKNNFARLLIVTLLTFPIMLLMGLIFGWVAASLLHLNQILTFKQITIFGTIIIYLDILAGKIFNTIMIPSTKGGYYD